MESPVVGKRGCHSSMPTTTNYDEGSRLAAEQNLRRKKSPTALKKRTSSHSCQQVVEDSTARPTHSQAPQKRVSDPVLITTRKSSLIVSPERTSVTPPKPNTPTKIKSPGAGKSNSVSLKNDTTPRRRRSLGPVSIDQNGEHVSKTETNTTTNQRPAIDLLKEKYPIVRQSSDSELKRKSKMRLTANKTTPSRKDGSSLDEYVPDDETSPNEFSVILPNDDDDDTVNTDPLSGTKRTEPRRALRSQRKSAAAISPSTIMNEGPVPRVRSRSRSIPRRPNSRERKRADLERTEAIKFLTTTAAAATTTTTSSSFIDSMTSFSSALSGSSRAVDDMLEQVLVGKEEHDNNKNNNTTRRSLQEMKRETRRQEDEGDSDDLARKIEDLENKLVQAQAETEVARAKNRRSKLEHDRLIAEKDKEIRELNDILAQMLNGSQRQTKDDAGSGATLNVIETRLLHELVDAKAKIARLEKDLSDAYEQNSQLQAEIRCYKSCDSSKYAALWAAETEC